MGDQESAEVLETSLLARQLRVRVAGATFKKLMGVLAIGLPALWIHHLIVLSTARPKFACIMLY